jgi:hypothetical protein
MSTNKVMALALVGAWSLVGLLVACGDDDDDTGNEIEAEYEWQTSETPHGVTVDCLIAGTTRADGGIALWCTEVTSG